MENITSAHVLAKRCKTCKRRLFLNADGTGYCWYCTEIAKEDEQLARDTEQNHKKKLIQMLEESFSQNSLVNEKLKKATFENYVAPTEELEKAKKVFVDFVTEYDPENPQSLLVIGSYGTGKSHLAFAAAKEMIKGGNAALFIQVNRLLTKIKSTWSNNSKLTEDKLMDIIASVDLLVIDDFGAEFTDKDKDQVTWKVTKMNEIIDSRCGRATIFTTNFTIVDLKSMYGERDFSRMIQDAEPLEMYGENYRYRKFLEE